MGGAASWRRGRAWLYGLMLPKIQTDMLGTIPLRITWYMCAETYFPTSFLGEHTCCVIPLMENLFLGAAGAFFEGSVPPFGCIWLWAMCQTGCTSHSHCTCLGMPLCFFLCLCVHYPGSSQVLPLVFQLFSFLCACVYSPFSVSIPFHISIHYNNPLSQSHFSACDLSGSEFPMHCLLLLCPRGCREGGRRAKLRRGTPWGAA